MELEEARQIAAQAWCTGPTEGTEMDVDLAHAFADILRREVNLANEPSRSTRDYIALQVVCAGEGKCESKLMMLARAHLGNRLGGE